jgi:hypothetical protein
MIGAYKHSVFMYSYKLTLIDSENYEIEERSDLGSERTIGTWSITGREIWLIPKKKITVDDHKKRDETDITDPKTEVVEVETEDTLALKTKIFKLVRTN